MAIFMYLLPGRFRELKSFASFPENIYFKQIFSPAIKTTHEEVEMVVDFHKISF